MTESMRGQVVIAAVFWGQDPLVAKKLQSLLPVQIPLFLVSSMEELSSIVGDFDNQDSAQFCIFFDARRAPQAIQPVPAVRQLLSGRLVRIYAIIGSQKERKAVLNGGVDDYLMSPLLQEEIQRLIETFLPAGETGLGAGEPEPARALVSEQELERERLVTTGRLTSTLIHEVNNSMQSIRGALALALEMPEDFQEVMDYVRLSYQETGRVVEWTSLVREIYRPPEDRSEAISAREILEKALRLAGNEMGKQDIQCTVQLTDPLPLVRCAPNQLTLAVLIVLLSLVDRIKTCGSGQMVISVMAQNLFVLFDIGVVSFEKRENAPGAVERSFPRVDCWEASFSTAVRMIQAMDGQFHWQEGENGLNLRILLPALKVTG